MTSPANPPKRIGIGIILRDGHVLVGIRGSETVLAGKHEFPGGKCLSGEEFSACVIRECLEETGLSVVPIQEIDQRTYSYEHGSVALSFWLCRTANHDPQNLKGNFQWVPVAELSRLNFPEANRVVLDWLNRDTDSFIENRS
ncbi:MAG: (deoxy)nucleoside triphosphate pyrophosphohydrolase [Planctomycetaceae bacterium]|nr:(deoxy)nucleoside triphosphate pyrophosphohydrolase [Planctomycetaceae bacterium]